jgi:hypothetical protein
MSAPARLAEQPPLVFVSYAHEDRERVKPLVARLKRRRWDVWWDHETRIGSHWRDVIDDRLLHARCVIAVWTRSSVRSRWVRDEAESAANRGVLVPARLDAVEPPRGFGEFTYADLAGWQGGRHQELDQLLKSAARLIDGALEFEPWQSLNNGIVRSKHGLLRARDVMTRIRTQTGMFKRNPDSAAALGAALSGVADTFQAVDGAVERFLAPIDARAALTPTRYRRLATGRLTAEIEAKRGHCTRIGQAYIEDGGLRDALPDSTDDTVVAALDDLFLELSHADDDLFAAMVAVGGALANESSALVNLLLAGQKAAASARLGSAERQLAPLVRDLNKGRASLNRLAGELGIVISGF